MFLIEIVFLLLVIAAAILLVQGTRKIPVQYAKRIVGNKQYGGARQYIPLKVNAANVMPIIFAQAIMFIPITLVGFSNAATASGIVRAFVDHTSFWYNFVFAILIIVFTYFYTAITINPNQMAEDMKRNNGFIPGIKQGKNTAEYIDAIMSRITLPLSLIHISLLEDSKIRKYLNARLAKASVSRIVIERTLKLVTITVCTARPGIIIGKGGQEVDKLKEELKKITDKDIQINIFEVKRPELDAVIVANNIARQANTVMGENRLKSGIR